MFKTKRWEKILALCFVALVLLGLLFSRTLININTPRVVAGKILVQALQKEMRVQARFAYKGAQTLSLELPEGYTARLKEYLVQPGDSVSPGQVLALLEPDKELLRKRQQVKDELNAARLSFVQTDKQSAAYAAYLAYQEAQDRLLTQADAGLEMGAEEAEEALCKYLNDGIRLEELTQMEKQQRRLQELETQWLTLDAAVQGCQRVTAPSAGFVTELCAKPGGMLANLGALLVLSPELYPGVCAELTAEQAAALSTAQRVEGCEIELGASRLAVTQWEIEDGETNVLLWMTPATQQMGLSGKRCSAGIRYETQLQTAVPLSALHDRTATDATVYLLHEEEGFWGRESRVRALHVQVLDSDQTHAAIRAAQGSSVQAGERIAVSADRMLADDKKVLCVQ